MARELVLRGEQGSPRGCGPDRGGAPMVLNSPCRTLFPVSDVRHSQYARVARAVDRPQGANPIVPGNHAVTTDICRARRGRCATLAPTLELGMKIFTKVALAIAALRSARLRPRRRRSPSRSTGSPAAITRRISTRRKWAGTKHAGVDVDFETGRGSAASAQKVGAGALAARPVRHGGRAAVPRQGPRPRRADERLCQLAAGPLLAQELRHQERQGSRRQEDRQSRPATARARCGRRWRRRSASIPTR